MNRYMQGFKKGDLVKCIAARDERNLTLGREYLVVVDEEEGIFKDRPFVTVWGDEGKVTCHSSRFKLLKKSRQRRKRSPLKDSPSLLVTTGLHYNC